MRWAVCGLIATLFLACEAEPEFRSRITSHWIDLTVFPREHGLTVKDRFEVESGIDGLAEIALLSSGVTVDSVRTEGRTVTWSTRPGILRIGFSPPLARGEKATLLYAAHAEDFRVMEESEHIVEIAIGGQVRSVSSFSFSAFYYPVDARNDAAVRLAIRVPEGYRAVSGGRSCPLTLFEMGMVEDVFDDPARRPRLMPFGFAVARYGTLTRKTPGGLTVELHHLPDHEDRAPRWLDVAVRAAAFFEETIGPLPWDRVAICQVAPLRGGAGCSLPGQILFSEDLVGRDGELFVDEMSHQWNAYLAPLPNELAEGFATFSVAMYLEREKGAERYRREISSYRSAYLLEVRHGGDRAVSEPGVYSTPAYRGIAFCKTAVGLGGLRKRLGDERFFAGWRRVFETVREPETAYEDVRHAFEYAAGEDLRAYFDGWLHRPGFPEIALGWRAARVEAGPGIEVVLTQMQEGLPFEIDLDVAVRTEGEGTVTREASLRSREQTFRWALPAWPAGAGLDPHGTALCRRARR